MEAIANGNTTAGLRARELCAEAARRRAEELKAMEADDGEKKAPGGLSVEALTAHTQGTGEITVHIYINTFLNFYKVICRLLCCVVAHTV